MLVLWAQFFILVGIIGVAGFKLSAYGDEIAEQTGLGRNWIGFALLAAITSLPELSTGISSVSLAKNPDLAVGDILGSCVFNLLIVFLLDLYNRGENVYSRGNQGHILSGALGIILISYVSFSLLVATRFSQFQIGHVGLFAALIPFFYFLVMKILFSYEKRVTSQDPETAGRGKRQIKGKTLGKFTVAATCVVGAGSFLPFVGEKIMFEMGWSATFVGTLFIAFATSLPELSVTLGAIRIGSIDLALSNILGSNLFNCMILTIDDFFYLEGPLFQDASPAHAVTGLSAILMTSIVMTCLIEHPKLRVLGAIHFMSLLLLGIYLANCYLIFA